MSGVRIYNDELKKLGMTLPGFIERGNVIASLPCLGLLTLAGNTPENWSVDYLEVDQVSSEIVQKLISAKPDLVAMSSLSARINDAYLLSELLRSCGIHVVIGGLHASALPLEAVKYADSVAVGQGERLWSHFLKEFEAKRVPTIFSSGRKPELEPPKIPAFHLLNPDKYNRIPLQTTRGCPLDCSFCAASRLISDYGRKPLNRIDEELEAIGQIWPKPFIELADDNTFVNKEWGKKLALLLGKHKVKWFTETDISIADDDELLHLLAESGCSQLLIGLESVESKSLLATDSKGWKHKKRDQYMEAIEKIQSAGISVNGCFVFGFDSDTDTVFEDTLEFVRTSGLSEVQVTILTPFLGTKLYADLKSSKRLLRAKFWDQCTLFDLTYRPANMSVKAFESSFRHLVKDLHSDSEVANRKKKFVATARKRIGGVHHA